MSTAVVWVGHAPLSEGMRLVLDDGDYMYGVGRIKVVVRRVSAVAEFGSDLWVHLDVDQVMFNGALVPRTLTARVKALPEAVLRGMGRR